MHGGNYKVKPLSHLMKTVKIKDKTLVLDSVKLFNRLVIVSQQELSVKESYEFELTAVPMSLFDKTQFMRKPNKALLGKPHKEYGYTRRCNKAYKHQDDSDRWRLVGAPGRLV